MSTNDDILRMYQISRSKYSIPGGIQMTITKEQYFRMVDDKREFDAHIDRLHKEYQEIWWGDDNRRINENLKWGDIYTNRRDQIIQKMADARKDIDKAILKEWKTEYGQSRGLV
jgi:hypothetical protein